MRIYIGNALEGFHDKRGRVEIYFEPRDIWIGVYVSPDAVYICPLPMLVLRVSRGGRWRW